MNIQKPLVPIITNMTSERLLATKKKHKRRAIILMLGAVTLLLIAVLVSSNIFEEQKQYRGTFVSRGGIMKVGCIYQDGEKG